MLIDAEKLKATISKHCESLNCRLIDRDELFEMIDEMPEEDPLGEIGVKLYNGERRELYEKS